MELATAPNGDSAPTTGNENAPRVHAEDLIFGDTIDLSRNRSTDEWAKLLAALEARKRAQEENDALRAQIDALLTAAGKKLSDVGLQVIELHAEGDRDDEDAGDEGRRSQAPGGKKATAKKRPAAKAASKESGVVYVLKGSQPKVFHSYPGRVPRDGCFKDGRRDASKWREMKESERDEYAAWRASRPKR